jgi:hypothetical protein
VKCSTAMPQDVCPCGKRAVHIVVDPPARTYADAQFHCQDCHPPDAFAIPRQEFDAKRKPYTDHLSKWNRVYVPFRPVEDEETP